MAKRNEWQKKWESVQKEARTLAKRANQRMVRLERYSKREGLGAITEYSYKTAQEYLAARADKPPKSEGYRFKEKVELFEISDGSKNLEGSELYKKNIQIQRERIKAMREFLESESSTLGQSRAGRKTKGIKQIYKERAKTISDKFLKEYGMKLSEHDLKRFFDSKKQAKLEKDFGSENMFIIASVIKKYNIKGRKRDLERFFKSHIELDKHKELSAEDLKAKQGESKTDYVKRLGQYVDYTKDPVLNKYVAEALEKGFSMDNIFI